MNRNEVWQCILGTKGFGLSSARQENLVAILGRDLGLWPSLVQHTIQNGVCKPFDKDTPLNLPAYRDHMFQFYYTPDACATATNTNPDIWMSWLRGLLRHKRADHPHAAKVDGQLLSILGGKPFYNRVISLEAVVWFLAVRERWPSNKKGRIQTVKDLIEKHGVETVPVSPNSDANTEQLFDNLEVDPRIRVPKAGRRLVSYKPTTPTTSIEELDSQIKSLQETRDKLLSDALLARVSLVGGTLNTEGKILETLLVEYPDGRVFEYATTVEKYTTEPD